MTISRIEVKDGKLKIEFTPMNKEKTSIQFEGKSNKLMVDALPTGIDITHKTVNGQSIFEIRARHAQSKQKNKHGEPGK
ncbi:MAG: hypothetical protein QW112_02840 [Candidatus Micrarchaeia archaeon]